MKQRKDYLLLGFLVRCAFVTPRAELLVLPLNKRVLVRVTEKKGNRAICETVEEFEGARYVGSFESGYMIAKGDTYSVKVESVDNAKHTFKARQPKVTE